MTALRSLNRGDCHTREQMRYAPDFEVDAQNHGHVATMTIKSLSGSVADYRTPLCCMEKKQPRAWNNVAEMINVVVRPIDCLLWELLYASHVSLHSYRTLCTMFGSPIYPNAPTNGVSSVCLPKGYLMN